MYTSLAIYETNRGHPDIRLRIVWRLMNVWLRVGLPFQQKWMLRAQAVQQVLAYQVLSFSRFSQTCSCAFLCQLPAPETGGFPALPMSRRSRGSRGVGGHGPEGSWFLPLIQRARSLLRFPGRQRLCLLFASPRPSS